MSKLIATLGSLLGSLSLVGGLGACSADPGSDQDPSYSAQSQVEYLTAPLLTPAGGERCTGDIGVGVSGAQKEIENIRAMAGLPPLDCDPAAARAAKAHCKYVAGVGALTHEQQSGTANFSGKTFVDRLSAQGFGMEGSGEVLASLIGGSAISDPRGLLNSVYHRPFFLRAENVVFGYGDEGACAGVVFGRKPATPVKAAAVVWPPDQATAVPVEFHAARESPNPMPGASPIVGSPISWIGTERLSDERGTLTGPDGEVATRLITHDNDPNKMVRPGEMHLVPLAPLQPRTAYTAVFTARTKTGEVTAKTRFTTAAGDSRWTP